MSERAHSALPYPPVLMRRSEAAAYVRVSPNKFDQWVADGRMPKPVRVDSCVLWHRDHLDAYAHALFDHQEEWNFQA